MSFTNVRNVFGCLLALLIFAAACPAQEAGKWSLKPIDGDNTKNWEAGSWTWEMGNPCEDHGATWTVAFQNKINPEPGFSYTPMNKGTYVGFIRIWQGDADVSKDPRMQYQKNQLIARPANVSAQQSESVAILFKPKNGGEYQVNIKSVLDHVQNPTAGDALVGVYLMSTDGRLVEKLQESELNVKKPGVFGNNLPQAIEFNKTVTFAAGQELILRLQAVNPGNASVGACALKIDEFTVTLAK